MQSQNFLNENKSTDYDNNVFIDMLQDAAAGVTDNELENEELATYVFSDGSFIACLADQYLAFENIDSSAVEWDEDLCGYYVIDTEALGSDVPGVVFEDSYGNGVALYNNTSCATYRDLAIAADLDYRDYATFFV
jgi:hypothetical protein